MGIKSTRDTLIRKLEEVAETSTDLEQLSYAGASLSKLTAVNPEIILEDDAYNIGTPGTFGFGVAAIPDELLPADYVKLSGHSDTAHENYGAVMDVNGSIFVYIPKFYYKMTGNIVNISSSAKNGYVLHRAFVDSPNGFLQFKYLAGNVGGKLVSKPLLDPVSTSTSHNPIGSLISKPANNYGGFVDACVGMGYQTMSIFEWNALGLLALAQSQSGASTALVAFNDVAPFFPKGNNNNALKDVNDNSVSFIASGYSNCALTASASNLAKTTHNGQASGVADVNGNMYKIATGLTYLAKTGATCTNGETLVSMSAHGLAVDDVIYFGSAPYSGSTYNTNAYTITAVNNSDSFTVNNALEREITTSDGVYSSRYFRILKVGVHPRVLTADILLNEANYELLDLTGIIDNNAGSIYMGNGSETVLNFSTNTNTNDYKKASVGIPTSTGVNGSGTTEFGNDRLYRYLRHGLVPFVGGGWNIASAAGVFLCSLATYSSNSDAHVGGFASVSL